jgi:choline kinase
MRAIILAAGVGRRLGDTVREHPKCLTTLGKRALLDRMLDALTAAGVRDVVIVVGHLSEQIQAAVAGRAGVRTLFNPDYRKGAARSLWRARDEFDSDLLIMTADVLFPPALLRRLVESPHPDCVLMDVRAENDGEAQMLMARNGRVEDITRGLRGAYDACGEYVGFMKLSRESAAVFRRLLGEALGSARDGMEPEEVFPALMRERVIRYERTDGFSWIEIDFPEDLERARRLVCEGVVSP